MDNRANDATIRVLQKVQILDGLTMYHIKYLICPLTRNIVNVLAEFIITPKGKIFNGPGKAEMFFRLQDLR